MNVYLAIIKINIYTVEETSYGIPPISATFQPTLTACQFYSWRKLTSLDNVLAKTMGVCRGVFSLAVF